MLQDKPAEKPAIKVGRTTRAYVDEKRKNWQGTGPRPLITTIWYPASADATEETPGDPDGYYKAYKVALNAPIATNIAKYPLILLSHGSTSVGISLEWLAYSLVSHGYIVAAVNHHGDSWAEGQPLPQGFLLLGERPIDLTALLDKLLTDPAFGSHIDRERIGAAGHSAGGGTVIQLAGAVFKRQEFADFCKAHPNDPACDIPPPIREMLAKLQEQEKTDPIIQAALRREGDSHRDKRIKGVLAMAPAIGQLFTEARLRSVTTSVSIVSGTADDITPIEGNAKRYAKYLKNAILTVLPGNVGHFEFGSECTNLGKKTQGHCWDGEGIDRAAIHEQVCTLAYQFFERVWAENKPL